MDCTSSMIIVYIIYNYAVQCLWNIPAVARIAYSRFREFACCKRWLMKTNDEVSYYTVAIIIIILSICSTWNITVAKLLLLEC